MSTDTQQDAREQARHISEVTKAYAEGKEIQTWDGESWVFPGDKPVWNFAMRSYRVKPEERKPREVKLWISDNLADVFPESTLIHNSVGHVWRLATFVEKVLPETETE